MVGLYKNEYPPSLRQLEADLRESPADTYVTRLTVRIIEGAKRLDVFRIRVLGVDPRIAAMGGRRDCENPPAFTHEHISGAPYADDPQNPLEPGEEWNKGRRATLTGLSCTFNDKNIPLNPYMNAGLNERGVLGQFGPNHAIDNGAMLETMEDGNLRLYAMGILKQGVPYFAGGFVKYKKDEGGNFVFDEDVLIDSRVEEFFEEMVSGSVELEGEYAARLQDMTEAAISRREEGGGVSLSDEKKREIKRETETELKLEQVREKDPGFMERLRQVIERGHECFAGPVLNATRSTNEAWIETRLTWYLMDDEVWNRVKGENPVYDYRFVAGDDAEGFFRRRLDADLIKDANASHAPMFAFMAASYLLDKQKNGAMVSPATLEQLTGMAEYLDTILDPFAEVKQAAECPHYGGMVCP